MISAICTRTSCYSKITVIIFLGDISWVVQYIFVLLPTVLPVLLQSYIPDSTEEGFVLVIGFRPYNLVALLKFDAKCSF